MPDLREGSTGRATRRRGTQVPRQRTDGPSGGRPTGRAAARAAASRSVGRGGARRRVRPASRGRRVLRAAGICLALVVLAAGGAGWWFYQHLNGNITSVSLDGKGGSEKADAFGRTPINILVIGSDGRTSAEDCKLGGGCSQTGVQSGNGNADVEMVVHIAADRSNATVMSIPRDTMTNVPACKDSASGTSTSGYYGQINSALSYGPACQVATIHQLTGIPIDHFVKLDFAGVVSMSDAVGGVSVCVSDNVYDTYSHLKLSKGTHTLKGVGALEFVRSRHGFGDGSDLGRTVSQHLFLGSMIRKFKSAGTLTDPTAVYDLANAATKALTVDDGLGSISKLAGLASDVNKVPSHRITFTTMQTAPDPANKDRVVPGAGAKSLFATIANDQSLTDDSGKKSTTATATASPQTVDPSRIAVKIENGTGTSQPRASELATALTSKGFGSGTTTANAPSTTTTTALTYGAGQKPQAQTVAKALGLPSSHLKQGSTDGLTLVIGSDWPSGTTYPSGSTSSPAPADTHAAVSNAHAETADQPKSCAQVSPYKTVQLNGVPMTPAQAYAAATNQPDSDT
ncbi:LCP family protein [Streptomyces sp. FXJ1.172]|uniref:LCP family protein n=1 Tax=Streptomyces sp. FXJ1.172 TaxID=710705 RepID=UPI0007CF0F86|nr:LCP family protein [Streptomyces sp. FXJ1.172]WEO94670.1 LCP family protein [Streptomyces sp. FXJ1.172]